MEKIEKTEPRAGTIADMLNAKREALSAVMAQNMDPAQFIAIALRAISRNRDLLQALPHTLYAAIHDAASLGLSLDPRVGEFYLIPRKNKHMRDAIEVTGLIGYKGLIALAMRTGLVQRIVTNVVYEGEAVEIDIAHGVVRHPYTFAGVVRKPEKIVGAYSCIWLHGDPQPVLRPLTRAQIDKRRAFSQARSGPWVDWYEEMARKTAVRAALGGGAVPLTAVAVQGAKSGEKITLGEALDIDDRGNVADDDAEAIAEQDETPALAPPVEGGQVIELSGMRQGEKVRTRGKSAAKAGNVLDDLRASVWSKINLEAADRGYGPDSLRSIAEEQGIESWSGEPSELTAEQMGSLLAALQREP